MIKRYIYTLYEKLEGLEITFLEFVRAIDIIPELGQNEKREIILEAAKMQGCF